jgi:hypothetical protein
MLNILWLAVIALFVLWIVGLGVGWASNVVWTLFIVGLFVLGIAIVYTIFKGFRPRRPTPTA